MCPDEEADQGNSNRRERHPLIAEQRFADEYRQNLADHPQPGQHEHIHCRVRVKPEQVLEQDNDCRPWSGRKSPCRTNART